ncbi:MAG: PqiC family protein [Acetobacteraceae bacterium]
MTALVQRLTMLLVLLLLGACASAPSRFYTLGQVSPASAPIGGPALHPPIEVGQVPIPAVLDRNEIVIAAAGDRLDVAGRDRWAAPRGQLIRLALTEDLTSRLPPGSVLQPGAVAPNGGLRVLTLNIQRFIGDSSGLVRLDATWSLIRGGSSDILRSGRTMIQVQATSAKTEAIVPAMSQAIGKLADQIAAALL